MKLSRYLLVIFDFLLIASNGLAQLPALTIGNSGNASGCAPHTVVFNIDNVAGNAPSTTYALDFGDGSPVLNYTQANIASTVSHTYSTVACGQTFGGQFNSFGATLTATNASGSTTGTIAPIRISKKPNASFTLSPTPICVGSTITFTNISDPGVTYISQACNTNPIYYWDVTGPSSGTFVTGSLGSNGGFPANINAWTSGTSSLTMQFTTPGSYQMKLYIGNSCGIDDTTLNFTVVNSSPSISLGSNGNSQQCAPASLDFTLSSFGSNSAETIYSVIYGDGSATQVFNHPPPAILSHAFTESSCGYTSTTGFPDAFWVQVSAQNACDIAISTIEPIRISTPPIANYVGLPSSACNSNPIVLNSSADIGTNVNVSGCNTNHGMVWSISPALGWTLSSGSLGSANGSPSNYLGWTSGSNQLSIVFSTPGIYTVTQRIQNSCAEDTVSETISVNSTISADAGSDQSVCLGSTTTQLIGIPSGGTWSGVGVTPLGIFTPSVLGNIVLTYSFSQNGCIASDQIVITVVNPALADAGAQQELCINTPTINLFGTPIGGVWSGDDQVTATGTFTPNTEGNYTLTYTIGAGSCASSDQTVVTVNALPEVTFVLEDTLFCNSEGPVLLNSGVPEGGAYFGNGVNNALFEPVNATIGLSSIVYSYIDGNGCLNTATAEVTVEICSKNNFIQKDINVNIYPNPSSGLLNIQIQEGLPLSEITLFSVDGKIIFHQQLNTTNTLSLDFSSVSAGVYMIQYQSAENVLSLPWYKFN